MLNRLSDYFIAQRHGITLAVYIAAAMVTGAVCIGFMWSFEYVLDHRLDFSSVGHWCWLSTPLLFLLSVEMIRRLAPCADGSGIPQSIFAAQHYDPDRPATETRLRPLTSLRTLSVKIIALLAGLLAGASTGREGPTVHVSICVFVTFILLFRRLTGISLDLRSAVIAGAASGLAAAFNTPLAGVTFAVEELGGEHFPGIKDFVIMAIIAAALVARHMAGDHISFGSLRQPMTVPLSSVLIVGAACGLLGSLFSTALLTMRRHIVRQTRGAGRIAVPIVLSLLLLTLAWFVGPDVLGPGNKVTQRLLNGETTDAIAWFPFTKMLSTLLTYWSGIAGGIFAPCLSMGAAIGAACAAWLGISIASCSLIGMGAFLSGAIQTPITAFVIVFEMTGHQDMLLPIMLGSLVAYILARALRARNLYHALSENYEYLLAAEPAEKADGATRL